MKSKASLGNVSQQDAGYYIPYAVVPPMAGFNLPIPTRCAFAIEVSLINGGMGA